MQREVDHVESNIELKKILREKSTRLGIFSFNVVY